MGHLSCVARPVDQGMIGSDRYESCHSHHRRTVEGHSVYLCSNTPGAPPVFGV